jgi:hypothetical protein
MADIEVKIPVELTQSMIIRCGLITDETRARALAEELHEVVLAFTKLRLADKRRLVELPSDEDLEQDPDAEPVELESLRGPNALEIADFVLATWRQAMIGGDVNPDGEEGAWISEELAALTLGDDRLWPRWCRSATRSPAPILRPCTPRAACSEADCEIPPILNDWRRRGWL